MIEKRIRGITFVCDETKGTARIITPSEQVEYPNAIEAWNSFCSLALHPIEREIRDKLEANGFNRWTGIREKNPEEGRVEDDF